MELWNSMLCLLLTIGMYSYINIAMKWSTIERACIICGYVAIIVIAGLDYSLLKISALVSVATDSRIYPYRLPSIRVIQSYNVRIIEEFYMFDFQNSSDIHEWNTPIEGTITYSRAQTHNYGLVTRKRIPWFQPKSFECTNYISSGAKRGASCVQKAN